MDPADKRRVWSARVIGFLSFVAVAMSCVVICVETLPSVNGFGQLFFITEVRTTLEPHPVVVKAAAKWGPVQRVCCNSCSFFFLQ